MDFSFSQETLMMQETLRKFITEEMLPLQEKHKLDREKPPPADLCKQMRKRSAELGFYGIDMPEDVGGMDIPAADRCLLFEESGKHDNVFANEVFGGAGGPTPVLLACNDKQKEKYLLPLMKGDITTCFGLSEPGAGSDATNIQTMAVKKGDKWILNGRKHYITNGPSADFAMVFASNDRAKRAKGGITCFLVDRDTPGADFDHPQHTMDGDGWVGELVFEDCEVPAENLLGQVGAGFSLAMKWINDGRLNICAGSVGIAKRMLKLSLDYARQREAFGTAIGNFQLIQAMLADMATDIFAAENMMYRAAWMKDQGQDIRKEAAMVKLFGAEMVNRVVDQAMQIHGGMGFMRETPIEHVMRQVRVYRIFEGTSEIQRLTIAKNLLKE
ncbi:MAG: acyl-CoA dehydrogenase family protein [Deltaproteobacteria bacterium]|nr:acyl-CoA dehydrogenase family protein [Deltaproteobacteria bacterium]